MTTSEPGNPYYSLDCEDGIENCALDFTTKSPEDILVEQEEEQLFLIMLERLAEAMGDLTDTQARRIHARYVLGKKLAEIAAAEGVSVSVVQQTIKSALKRMFLVIDSRYRSRKPLIVTTNLKLEEIKNPPDLAHARIYDRIMERCAPVLFSGRNFREEKAAATKEAARGIVSPK